MNQVESTALPLGFMKIGTVAIVKDLCGGIGMRQRLTEMGLVPGTKIKVIKNEMNGPLIISKGDERLAIGHGVSLKIMVEQEN